MSDRASVPSVESLLAHRAWLRAIARSLVGDEEAVDEVEQRTWMTVLRNRRPVASVKGWLRRVVRSAAADERRSEARRHGREERAARPEGMPPTDHLVAQAEAQRAVAAAVMALPEPYRGTVLLRYFEGLTPSEIAARSGVPVETVKTRLKRALAMLREALDRDFGDRRAWALVLVPLAKLRVPATGTGVAAGIAGGVAMGLKVKVLAAAVVVAVVAGIVWTAGSGPDTPEPVTNVAQVGTTDGGASASHAGRAGARDDGRRFALSGRVRSRLDGRPIEGARTVVVASGRGEGEMSAETDGRGVFRIDEAAAGVLRVTAPRHRAADVEVAAADGEAADVGDVWLDTAESLVVTVLGPGDEPVAGAEVRVVHREPYGASMTTDSYLRDVTRPTFGVTSVGTDVTGADGVVRFDDVGPGSHGLAVRAPGLVPAAAWAAIPAGSGETRTTVRLARGHALAGRVLDAAGAPAAGWFVDAGGEGWDERTFVRTDAEGRFRFEAVAAGDAQLSVGRNRGGAPVVETVRIPDVAWIDLRLPPTGAVVGSVTLPDGSPVAGAEVGVETGSYPKCSDAVATTDAEGRYRIADVPAGRLQRFVVRHGGLYHVGPRLESGELHDRRSGSAVEIAARVDAGDELRLDATMAPGTRLRGRVTGPDGPVGGAWVYLHLRPTKAGQEWETAVCDADGRYEFDILPPGVAAAVPLHASYMHPDAPERLGDALAAGKVADSLLLELPEGGDVVRDFTMVAGTRIAGRVAGPDGAPVADADIRCDVPSYRSPHPLATRTDADGRFVLDRVAGPGTTRLRATATGLVPVEAPVVTLEPAGRVDGIEIRMVAPPRVSGRVLDSNGGTVAGAEVTVRPAGSTGDPWRPVVVQADGGGDWQAALPRTTERLTVSARAVGHAPAQTDVAVGAGGVSVDLHLAALALVEGRVSGASGASVPGAAVVPIDASKRIWWDLGEFSPVDGQRAVVAAVTDSDGRFRVWLASGPWALLARATEYVDDVVRIHVPAEGEVGIVLRPATTLHGRLIDETGHPVRGAAVALEPGREVTSERFIAVDANAYGSLSWLDERVLFRHTRADGTFAFPGVPDGSYTLAVVSHIAGSRDPRVARFGPFRPSESPLVVRTGEARGKSIAGRLVAAGGAPLTDATGKITAISESSRSAQPWRADIEPDGTFRIEGVTSATCTLQVLVMTDKRAGRVPGGAVDVWMKSQQCVFHAVRVPANDLVLELTEGLRLTGRLVDERGAALAGVSLSASPRVPDRTVLTRQTTTRADGGFELQGLEDLEYRLSVNVGGQPVRRALLAHPPRGGQDLGDVVATLEARLVGVVTDSSGKPIAGASVSCAPVSGWQPSSATTGEDGHFEFTGLDPGVRYQLSLLGSDLRRWEFERDSSGFVRTRVPGETDVRLVRE